MANDKKYHTVRQLSEKDQAMDIMFEQMMQHYHDGVYNKCRDRFYNDIDSLKQLLREYKQG